MTSFGSTAKQDKKILYNQVITCSCRHKLHLIVLLPMVICLSRMGVLICRELLILLLVLLQFSLKELLYFCIFKLMQVFLCGNVDAKCHHFHFSHDHVCFGLLDCQKCDRKIISWAEMVELV